MPAQLRDPATNGSRSLALRMRTAINRPRLTASLAAGQDPASNPELGLRARQLTAMRHRVAIARALEETVASAEDPRVRMSAAAPLARREVRAARSSLRRLAAALREDGEVSPRGVALAERLLTDGSGPLYVERTNDALWRAATGATEALGA